MKKLKDFCSVSINKITLSLWGKGYYSVLRQRIIDMLKGNRYLGNNRIEYYLDLGSSDFIFYNKIVSLFKLSYSLTSDIICSAKSSQKNHIVCDFNNKFLPLRKNSFDLITCVNVIEHLFDTDNFFWK